MSEDGALVVLAIGDRQELTSVFATVPGARAWGQRGTWLATSSPFIAGKLRAILGEHDGIEVAPDVQAWLEAKPRPQFEVPVVVEPEAFEELEVEPAAAPAAVEPEPEPEPDVPVAAEPDASLAALRPLRGPNAAGDEPEPAPATPGLLDVTTTDGVTTLVATSDPSGRFAGQSAGQLAMYRRRHPGATTLPYDAWPATALEQIVHDMNLTLSPEAQELIGDQVATAADRARIAAMSRAASGELHIPTLNGELMDFQRAGIEYALERKRTLIADEQGLGKTVQALGAVEAAAAFPALVICPASLKLNWLREAGRWLPHREAVVVTGGGELQVDGAEIIVMNYEIAHAHVAALAQIQPRALVLDEAHYIKSPGAQRTRAVLAIADGLAEGALRLALTGTPVVNHPGELGSQLQALDRLREFGSVRDLERKYTRHDSRQLLHERLRGSCYVRRRKDDVLTQLPAKRRAIVTVPIDNQAEYELAERRFVRWLREQQAERETGELPGRLRAEAIVKLTALRRLAAHGKLAAALSWIEDFTASEERLVVFAHHRDIQGAVVERFPESARILGRDGLEQREANVRRFQSADGPELCVCSMEAASHGFTLTAAANVAFLELAWTPAKHDQAEDRVHRIGQDRGVVCWYLLAAGTIDERIARLLDEKRAVVGSVVDGTVVEGEGLVEALLGEMVG